MWVKICGIRDVATARRTAALGPDALGLNFFEGTPRCVPVETAAEIVEILPAEIEPVGVFVNHTARQIETMGRRCGIRAVQFHGDEPPEVLAELHARRPEWKLIRAFRIAADELRALGGYLDDCARLGVPLAACLVEARVEGIFGGSGQPAPWNVLAREYRRDAFPPLILAGGLTPENVGQAVAAVRPWGVDVAGGVEVERAVKDPERIRQFIAAARQEDADGN